MAPLTNILTIDLEEYFHPTEVQRVLPPDRWASLPSRVEPQTDWVLELLDRHSARATFFVLGWVAERYPNLVRRIAAAGRGHTWREHGELRFVRALVSGAQAALLSRAMSPRLSRAGSQARRRLSPRNPCLRVSAGPSGERRGSRIARSALSNSPLRRG